MEFQQRLPHSFKETVLFMLVISVLSVNIIAPLITGLEIGFSMSHWLGVLQQIPLLWLFVIALVFLTDKPSGQLANLILEPGTSFKATMLIRAMCQVFLMSLVLTVLGTWIGTRQITMAPINHFFQIWPRNFTIAFIVEGFIAQPIARSVMAFYHRQSDATDEA
ncbi:hypothetical protein [Furfurilactobacillus curtus]|uniref:DUF2798 domain-containing protein n=1 Tax=Furfurilactobacillus curtus TaxID=1746200 RepID=A0ABQ5JN97_9LACO